MKKLQEIKYIRKRMKYYKNQLDFLRACPIPCDWIDSTDHYLWYQYKMHLKSYNLLSRFMALFGKKEIEPLYVRHTNRFKNLPIPCFMDIIDFILWGTLIICVILTLLGY